MSVNLMVEFVVVVINRLTVTAKQLWQPWRPWPVDPPMAMDTMPGGVAA